VIAGNKYPKPHPEKDGAFLRVQHEKDRRRSPSRMRGGLRFEVVQRCHQVSKIIQVLVRKERTRGDGAEGPDAERGDASEEGIDRLRIVTWGVACPNDELPRPVPGGFRKVVQEALESFRKEHFKPCHAADVGDFEAEAYWGTHGGLFVREVTQGNIGTSVEHNGTRSLNRNSGADYAGEGPE
jgi:hypothetical protein